MKQLIIFVLIILALIFGFKAFKTFQQKSAEKLNEIETSFSASNQESSQRREQEEKMKAFNEDMQRQRMESYNNPEYMNH